MLNKMGSKIKSLRKENGFSLDKLADMAQTSKSYLWHLENDSAPNPGADKVKRIADALGVTIEYLTNDKRKLTSEIRKEALFTKYNKLNNHDKKVIEKIIDILLKNEI